MKAIFALSLLTVSSLSFAGTISSMDECSIALYKSNPWKKSYSLSNSRVNGKTANAFASTFLKAGATVQKVTDVLGVNRYDVITLVTTLEQEGTDINSCDGVSYANKVDVCTVDQTTKVCETFCAFDWRGVDCR